MMWTYARSQKAVNLRRDPRASFLVEDGTTYETLRGVLVTGVAELIDDPDEVLAMGMRLHRRYQQEGEDAAMAEVVRRQAAKRVVIAVPITRIASWDHRRLAQ